MKSEISVDKKLCVELHVVYSGWFILEKSETQKLIANNFRLIQLYPSNVPTQEKVVVRWKTSRKKKQKVWKFEFHLVKSEEINKKTFL